LRSRNGSTRKCIAIRWLSLALASENAFMVQRFRKIT